MVAEIIDGGSRDQARKDAQRGGPTQRVGSPPLVGSSVRGNSHTQEGKEVPPALRLKTNRRPSYWGNVPAQLCKC